MENPNIKEYTLMPVAAPKATDAYAGPLAQVGSLAKWLTTELLEQRLKANIVTGVLQQMAKQVKHLNVMQTKVSTVRAGEAVVD